MQATAGCFDKLSNPENTKHAYTRIAHAILGAKAIAGTGIQGTNAFAQDP